MRAFVIAMENEASAVREFARADDLFLVSGVGKVNAAAATQKAIDAGATEILNLGVVGALGPGIRVGDVFEVESAVEYDFDLAKINGTRIGQLNEYDTPFLPAAPTGMFPSKILATGDRFNDSEADNALIKDEIGAALRDMEGAAIAHVCLKNGVKFRSLKCVTDVVGGEPMTGQYIENLKRCLVILHEAAGRWV